MKLWARRRTFSALEVDFRWGHTRTTVSDTPVKVYNAFFSITVVEMKFFVTCDLDMMERSAGAGGWFDKPTISIRGFPF